MSESMKRVGKAASDWANAYVEARVAYIKDDGTASDRQRIADKLEVDMDNAIGTAIEERLS